MSEATVWGLGNAGGTKRALVIGDPHEPRCLRAGR